MLSRQTLDQAVDRKALAHRVVAGGAGEAVLNRFWRKAWQQRAQALVLPVAVGETPQPEIAARRAEHLTERSLTDRFAQDALKGGAVRRRVGHCPRLMSTGAPVA